MAKDQKHTDTSYRYNPETKNKEFITRISATETEVWQYKEGKGGGANEAGELGGVYKSPARTALFKQDPNPAKNIAEFLASQMHRSTHPEHQAEVFFAKVTDKAGKPTYPYIASIFFNNYQGDLFKYAYTSKGLIPPEDRPKFMGTGNLVTAALGIENTATLINEVLSSSTGFAESVVPRLLTNDMDMHSGNLGVAIKNGQEEIVSIDFGGANASLEEKIHPHSHTRHMPGLGPTNHFREYGRKYKITPAFAAECDKVAKHDYTGTIDDAFEKIVEYNNFKAIKAFGKLLGVPTKQLRIPDNEVNKEKLVGIIKEHYKVIIKARQEDLSKFSAQIKTDLCLKNYKETGELSYKDTEGKVITLEQVIKEHKGYFKAISEGNEKLKFRDNDNSKNYKALKETVLSTIEKTLAEEKLNENSLDNPFYKESYKSNPLYESKPATSFKGAKINDIQPPIQLVNFYPVLKDPRLEALANIISKSSRSSCLLNNTEHNAKENLQGALSTSPVVIKGHLTTTDLTSTPKAFENNQPAKIEGLKDIRSKLVKNIKNFVETIKEKFMSTNNDLKGR
ncbi:hypothetical protein H1Q59_01035 [Holosporaceae bacterium 'Namur']|nr:hypothetical protein [Holosporaceae bacterium 'Namur']